MVGLFQFETAFPRTGWTWTDFLANCITWRGIDMMGRFALAGPYASCGARYSSMVGLFQFETAFPRTGWTWTDFLANCITWRGIDMMTCLETEVYGTMGAPKSSKAALKVARSS